MGTVQRFTTRVERIATANSQAVLIVSLLAVASAGAYMVWRWLRPKDAGGEIKELGTGAPEHPLEGVNAGSP